MQLEFYSMPFALDMIMNKKEHPKCSLQQSVGQQLHLLITTSFGELVIDDTFGCSIWDFDFDNLTRGSRLKEIIRQSLMQSVSLHEKRLDNVRIDLDVRQEEWVESAMGRRVKKRMDIIITGVLHLTNEKFTFKDSFFLAPLSF